MSILFEYNFDHPELPLIWSKARFWDDVIEFHIDITRARKQIFDFNQFYCTGLYNSQNSIWIVCRKMNHFWQGFWERIFVNPGYKFQPSFGICIQTVNRMGLLRVDTLSQLRNVMEPIKLNLFWV